MSFAADLHKRKILWIMQPGIVDMEAAARFQARESEEWKVIAL